MEKVGAQQPPGDPSQARLRIEALNAWSGGRTLMAARSDYLYMRSNVAMCQRLVQIPCLAFIVARG